MRRPGPGVFGAIDGTFNALVEQLAWLKGVVVEDECRILGSTLRLPSPKGSTPR